MKSKNFRSCGGMFPFAWLAMILCASLEAQIATTEVHRTIIVNSTEPVVLKVEIPRAELEVLYSRDGQIAITGIVQTSREGGLSEKYFESVLSVEQTGNRVTVRHVPLSDNQDDGIKIRYRIDVPYRTELTAEVSQGKQRISGILGPVQAGIKNGDIDASYVTKGVQCRVEDGNVRVRVAGESVQATVARGNIFGERLPQGVRAETGDGDITLMVVGPSRATVRTGSGRIEVGGARGGLTASTDAGEIHVKAVPHAAWTLISASGNIGLELPEHVGFDLDASVDTGELDLGRDDLSKPEPGVRQTVQKVNGGGMKIEAHTARGRVVLR